MSNPRSPLLDVAELERLRAHTERLERDWARLGADDPNKARFFLRSSSSRHALLAELACGVLQQPEEEWAYALKALLISREKELLEDKAALALFIRCARVDITQARKRFLALQNISAGRLTAGEKTDPGSSGLGLEGYEELASDARPPSPSWISAGRF